MEQESGQADANIQITAKMRRAGKCAFSKSKNEVDGIDAAYRAMLHVALDDYEILKRVSAAFYGKVDAEAISSISNPFLIQRVILQAISPA